MYNLNFAIVQNTTKMNKLPACETRTYRVKYNRVGNH